MTRNVIIHIIFKSGNVTFKIPRIFFINYWNKIAEIENSIQVKRFRGGLSNEEMVQKQVTRIGELQYDAHLRIFNSVYLDHRSEDVTKLEYYLGEAIDKFMDILKEGKKEPREITVRKIYRARANPIIEVIK